MRHGKGKGGKKNYLVARHFGMQYHEIEYIILVSLAYQK